MSGKLGFDDFFRKPGQGKASGRTRDDRPRETVPGLTAQPFADGALLVAPYIRHEEDADASGTRPYMRTDEGLPEIVGVNITAGPAYSYKARLRNIYVPIEVAAAVLDADCIKAFERCMAGMLAAQSKAKTAAMVAAPSKGKGR